jgi:mono/diheme cytochrome c family protein
MIHVRSGRVALVAFTLSAAAALAQDLGEEEYMQACAACHGETGIGDGPLAGLMTVSVPDLTQLSARNDGVFPMLSVIQVIDGRNGVRAHGYPMPVWGDRFKAEAMPDAGKYGAELIVRGRILSIAYFLEAIQK